MPSEPRRQEDVKMSCQSCSGWEAGYCKRYGLYKLPLEVCDTWDASISIPQDNNGLRETNFRQNGKHLTLSKSARASFLPSKNRPRPKTIY